MLVLGRQVGQTVVFGGSIRATVFAIRGQQVRLGIEAPAEVPIFREEILRRSAPDAAATSRKPQGDSHSIGAASP